MVLFNKVRNHICSVGAIIGRILQPLETLDEKRIATWKEKIIVNIEALNYTKMFGIHKS